MASPAEIKKQIEDGLLPDPRKKGLDTEPSHEQLAPFLPKAFVKGQQGGFGAPIIDGETLRLLGIHPGSAHGMKADLSKITDKSREEIMNETYAQAKADWKAARDRARQGNIPPPNS